MISSKPLNDIDYLLVASAIHYLPMLINNVEVSISKERIELLKDHPNAYMSGHLIELENFALTVEVIILLSENKKRGDVIVFVSEPTDKEKKVLSFNSLY